MDGDGQVAAVSPPLLRGAAPLRGGLKQTFRRAGWPFTQPDLLSWHHQNPWHQNEEEKQTNKQFDGLGGIFKLTTTGRGTEYSMAMWFLADCPAMSFVFVC